MSMAQAASLLGQLPTPTSANNRNLLGSLCGMPLYNMEQALVSVAYLANELINQVILR